MEHVLMYLVLLTTVFIKATGDAFVLQLIQHRELVNAFKRFFAWNSEVLHITFLFGIGGLCLLWEYNCLQYTYVVGTYIAIRIAFFGLIWNLWTENVQWWYFGTTKLYDKFLSWIIHRSPMAKLIKPYPSMFMMFWILAWFLISLEFGKIFQLIYK